MDTGNLLALARLEDAIGVLYSIDCIHSNVDGDDMMSAIARLELMKNRLKNRIYADQKGWEESGEDGNQ